MDINCKECNQKYHIPDSRLDERRVYFMCEKCGNRVVIEGRKNPWFEYRGLGLSGYTARDLFEGIFFSFNRKNILISFFLLLCVSVFLAITSFIVRENLDFFAGHMVFSMLYAAAVLLIITLAYDIHLYLLSRNLFHRMKNGGNITFAKVRDEIFHDSRIIFMLSAGFVLCLMLLLVPVRFLRSYGLIYSGIFYPVLFSLSTLVVVVLYLKNILYAFVALKSGSARYSAAGIIRFIAVENVNIPAYIFLIRVICLVVLVFFSLFFFAAVLVIPGIGSMFQGGGFTGAAISFASLRGMLCSMPAPVTAGVVITGIMIFLFLLLFFSYMINLKQSLSVMSVYIMESNPGRSVSRTALLVFMIFLVASSLPVMLLMLL